MLLDNVSYSTSSATGGRAVADGQQLETDLNRFLTLLVTQLQNQDPLEPLDANEFTSQLVQFASVEQQIYQNANLETLIAAQNTSELSSSVGYIGHLVEAEGSSLPLQNGTAQILYQLPIDAKTATLTIRNPDGQIVFSSDVDTKAGEYSLIWDGHNQSDDLLPDGLYTFQMQATDDTGSAISATQGFAGLVTGVASNEDGAVLQLGAMELPLASVTAIRDRPTTASEVN